MSQYQVVFAFNLPYDRRLNFSQAVTMSTSAVVIMIPDNGVKLSGDMLQDGGVRDFQGTSYRMYNGSNLSAGSELVFEYLRATDTGRRHIDWRDLLAEDCHRRGRSGVGAGGGWPVAVPAQ